MSKERRPAFLFYPGDWLSSSHVQLMSMAERGAYMQLLCHSWMAPDCGLPADDGALAELSGLRGQWKKSGPKILERFDRIGDRYFNSRLVEERQKLDEWKQKSSDGGIKSAATRANLKRNQTSTTVARVVEECLQPNLNTRIENVFVLGSGSENLPEQEKLLRAREEIPSERFEELWAQWPRQTAKDAAFGAWGSYVTVANEDQVFACLERYKLSTDWQNGAIPNLGPSFQKRGWLGDRAADGWQTNWPRAPDRSGGRSRQQENADAWSRA